MGIPREVAMDTSTGDSGPKPLHFNCVSELSNRSSCVKSHSAIPALRGAGGTPEVAGSSMTTGGRICVGKGTIVGNADGPIMSTSKKFEGVGVIVLVVLEKLGIAGADEIVFVPRVADISKDGDADGLTDSVSGPTLLLAVFEIDNLMVGVEDGRGKEEIVGNISEEVGERDKVDVAKGWEGREEGELEMRGVLEG